MSFSIRRLQPEDAEIYREIRLEMLRDAREAFGDDYDEARQRPDSYWRESLSGERAYFGAFEADRIVGAVNFVAEKGAKSAHRGLLLGMFVRPEARGTGCALALVETVLEYARSKVIQVHLGVGATNVGARRLYEKAGFTLTGTEPRYLKVNGRFVDEHMMVRFLDGEK